jgi:hypothetical protein
LRGSAPHRQPRPWQQRSTAPRPALASPVDFRGAPAAAVRSSCGASSTFAAPLPSVVPSPLFGPSLLQSCVGWVLVSASCRVVPLLPAGPVLWLASRWFVLCFAWFPVACWFLCSAGALSCPRVAAALLLRWSLLWPAFLGLLVGVAGCVGGLSAPVSAAPCCGAPVWAVCSGLLLGASGGWGWGGSALPAPASSA